MLTLEQRSIQGCSALIAAEAAFLNHSDARRAKRIVKVQPPKSTDALDLRMCKRCGMSGSHETAMNCIEALRSHMGDLELQIDHLLAPASSIEPLPDLEPGVKRPLGRPRKCREPISEIESNRVPEPLLTSLRAPSEAEREFSRSLLRLG